MNRTLSPPLTHPDAAARRGFGLTLGIMIAAVFGAGLPWLFGRPLPTWPWALGAILAVWALTAPHTLTPVHRAWMAMAGVLGRINGLVLLTLIFALVVVPLGLARQVLGSDPMRRRWDPHAESYLSPAEARPPNDMERPF